MSNKNLNLIKYTYIHHPYYPEYVLTLARKWLNPEKTQMAVSWCANKCEMSPVAFVEDNFIPRLEVMDLFVKKTARHCAGGRLDSEVARTVVTLDKPWNRETDGSIVGKAIEAVRKTLPRKLENLVNLAETEGYKSVPEKRRLIAKRYIG